MESTVSSTKESNTSWLELNTSDPQTAVEFYSSTLGWEFEPTRLPDGGDYWVARHNNKPVGGVFALDDKQAQSIPAHWMTYMKVENIRKAQNAARKAGGDVARPILQLNGVGKLAIISDHQGALIGLIEEDGSNYTL